MMVFCSYHDIWLMILNNVHNAQAPIEISKKWAGANISKHISISNTPHASLQQKYTPLNLASKKSYSGITALW